jgi:hypothetical protein
MNRKVRRLTVLPAVILVAGAFKTASSREMFPSAKVHEQARSNARVQSELLCPLCESLAAFSDLDIHNNRTHLGIWKCTRSVPYVYWKIRDAAV